MEFLQKTRQELIYATPLVSSDGSMVISTQERTTKGNKGISPQENDMANNAIRIQVIARTLLEIYGLERTIPIRLSELCRRLGIEICHSKARIHRRHSTYPLRPKDYPCLYRPSLRMPSLHSGPRTRTLRPRTPEGRLLPRQTYGHADQAGGVWRSLYQSTVANNAPLLRKKSKQAKPHWLKIHGKIVSVI